MPKLNKDLVVKTIKGYEHGASVARKERLKQLQTLSPQESLADFLSLWKAWQKPGNKAGSKKLEQLKLKRLIEQRKRIDKLAHWKKIHGRSA